MRNTTAFLSAAFCLLPAAAFAQSPDAKAGTATGQFVIGEKSFPLIVAYANAEDDVENSRQNGPQKSLTLLFSAETVPPKERGEWANLSKRTRTGKLHAVQLRYDPAKKELFGATIFYITPDGKDSPNNISLSGGEGNFTLEKLTIKNGMVSGMAKMKEPENWLSFDDPEGSPPRQYTYSVSFSAPIVPPPPVTANLTGKAAQTSPQAALAAKFFKACQTGDLAALQVLATPNPEFEDFVKKQGVAQAKTLLKQFAPDAATFAKMPKRVIVRGDTATLIAGTVKSEAGSVTLKMVRKNKKWIVSR